MQSQKNKKANFSRIPARLRSLFWDYDFASITWQEDQNLILSRVLTSGDWDAVVWLRSKVDDRFLRQWITRHQGGGLSPQRLRFWEMIVGIQHRQVNGWLASKKRAIWDKRLHS